VRSSSREQRPIDNGEVRPSHLPAQDLKLVPQHQQLDILSVQTAAAADKCTQTRSKREVDERGTMSPILPAIAPPSADTDIGALQGLLVRDDQPLPVSACGASGRRKRARPDSNPRSPAWKAGAVTRPHLTPVDNST
jgi:hypothetical protein